MRAWIAGRTLLTDTITTYHIRPESAVSFLAGQYIELQAPHASADSRGDRRWFTISNAPGAPYLDLTMRLPRRRRSSFKQYLSTLADGAEVALGEVLGDFVVPKDRRVPLVFMADGIGLTPYLSMARDLANKRDFREIYMFHTVRQASDCIGYDLLAAAHIAVTTETVAQAQLMMPPTMPPKALYYLAGSEHPCLDMQQRLLASGVPRGRIALDYFTGYTAA